MSVTPRVLSKKSIHEMDKSLLICHESEEDYLNEWAPRVLSKKSTLKMDKSLAICRQYKDVDSLDVHDREEAMEYLNEWAAKVEVGLHQHLYQPQVMMAWLACMSSFLHVQAHYVHRRELVLMVVECLPRLLEVLAYYTTWADIKTRHQVCRAVVNVLRTMAADDQGHNPQADLDTRVLAGEVVRAYLAQLTADEMEWRVVFNNPVWCSNHNSDYDDDHAEEVTDVEHLGTWVRAGMFLKTPTGVLKRCPCFKCRTIL